MTPRVLLIISGGIAAYKTHELIRLLRRRSIGVTGVLTEAAQHFITPLTVQALSENRVYTDLFSLTDENEMGHIRLSRVADLVVVAPASANLLAAMAHGTAADLAGTLLLATDKPVLVAPAMNVRMWQHPATVATMATLIARGVHVVGPREGEMACGEFGPGRLAEPPEILAAILALLARTPRGSLAGRRALVTSGPTQEPIDPVRYLANRSSGRQGHAIAAALAAEGAEVTLVRGPVTIADPPAVRTVAVQTAVEMLEAVRAALPAEIAVCAAAVADWRVEAARHKVKKVAGAAPPSPTLVANPDILAELGGLPPGQRPRLVIGFAAETEHLLAHATEKRARKAADWIVANDVSPDTGVFGGGENAVHLITDAGIEAWPRLGKDAVATRLVARIAERLGR